jgi:hypothetical protein
MAAATGIDLRDRLAYDEAHVQAHLVNGRGAYTGQVHDG